MIPDNWREAILSLADAYCEKYGVKRTVLSNQIAKDADFIDHIGNGGGCTVDKCQRVLKLLRSMQPDAVPNHAAEKPLQMGTSHD